jgi:hypothetical protein
MATIVPERSSSGIAGVARNQEGRRPMMSTTPALRPQCEILMRRSSLTKVRARGWVVERVRTFEGRPGCV